MARFSILNNSVFGFVFFVLVRVFLSKITWFILYYLRATSSSHTHILCVIACSVQSHCSTAEKTRKKGGKPLKTSWCWWCEMIIYQSRIIDLLMHWMNLSMLTLVPRSYTHWWVQPKKLVLILKSIISRFSTKFVRLLLYMCMCSVLRIYRKFRTNYIFKFNFSIFRTFFRCFCVFDTIVWDSVIF